MFLANWVTKNYLSYVFKRSIQRKYGKLVKAGWGYKCFFDSYSTNTKGVAILFINNF